MPTENILLILAILLIGSFFLRGLIWLGVQTLKGAAVLFCLSLEKGLVGVCAYLVALVLLFPIMVTLSLIVGLALSCLDCNEESF